MWGPAFGPASEALPEGHRLPAAQPLLAENHSLAFPFLEAWALSLSMAWKPQHGGPSEGDERLGPIPWAEQHEGLFC